MGSCMYVIRFAILHVIFIPVEIVVWMSLLHYSSRVLMLCLSISPSSSHSKWSLVWLTPWRPNKQNILFFSLVPPMTTKQIHSLKKRKVVTKTKMKKMTTMTSCLFEQERLRIRGYRELSRGASHLFHDFIRGRLGHSSYCQLRLGNL